MGLKKGDAQPDPSLRNYIYVNDTQSSYRWFWLILIVVTSGGLVTSLITMCVPGPDLSSGWHTRSIMYKYATFQFRCIQLMFQEKSVLLVADQLSGMRNYFWKTALCKMGNEIGACETWQSKAQAHDLKRCTLISLITLPRPIWWINSLWPFIFSCLTPIRRTKTHRWQSSIESRSPRSGIFAANWQGHEHIWTSNFSTNYVRKNSLSLGVNGSVSDFKHRKTPYCFSLLKL